MIIASAAIARLKSIVWIDESRLALVEQFQLSQTMPLLANNSFHARQNCPNTSNKLFQPNKDAAKVIKSIKKTRDDPLSDDVRPTLSLYR